MRSSFLKGAAVGFACALLAGATVALAGSGVGGVFNLGVSNSVDAKTTLTGASPGIQLQVTNTSTTPSTSGLAVNSASGATTGVFTNNGGGSAGGFFVNPGVKPFTVNSQTKVGNLNADLLDGLDSPALQKRVTGTCPAGTAVRLVNSDGSVACQAVGTGAAAWGVATTTGSAAQLNTGVTSFADFPGATATISVPGPGNGLVMARFSAESACYQPAGNTAGNWCSVLILVDGVEMSPRAGLDFAFDSTNEGAETGNSWESHSMDRLLVVGPGNHTVVVQWAVTGPDVTFRLDDWSLTIERAPV
jgi:hypothetical protein